MTSKRPAAMVITAGMTRRGGSTAGALRKRADTQHREPRDGCGSDRVHRWHLPAESRLRRNRTIRSRFKGAASRPLNSW